MVLWLWLPRIIVFGLFIYIGCSVAESVIFTTTIVAILKGLSEMSKRFIAKRMFIIGMTYLSDILLLLDVMYCITKDGYISLYEEATDGLDDYVDKLNKFIHIAPKRCANLTCLAEQLLSTMDELTKYEKEGNKLAEYEQDMFKLEPAIIDVKLEIVSDKIKKVSKSLTDEYSEASADFISNVFIEIERYKSSIRKLKRGV